MGAGVSASLWPALLLPLTALACGADRPAPVTPTPAISAPAPPYTPSPSTFSPPQPPATADAATADWRTFHATRGQFSLQYPSGWSLLDCTNTAQDPLIVVSTSAPAQGPCPTEGFAEIEVLAGTLTRDPFPNNFRQLSASPVTVGGVPGRRRTGVGAGGEGLAPRADTTAVEYLLAVHGRTYIALYVRAPGQADMAAQFDQMVTRGLRFSS